MGFEREWFINSEKTRIRNLEPSPSAGSGTEFREKSLDKFQISDFRSWFPSLAEGQISTPLSQIHTPTSKQRTTFAK